MIVVLRRSCHRSILAVEAKFPMHTSQSSLSPLPLNLTICYHLRTGSNLLDSSVAAVLAWGRMGCLILEHRIHQTHSYQPVQLLLALADLQKHHQWCYCKMSEACQYIGSARKDSCLSVVAAIDYARYLHCSQTVRARYVELEYECFLYFQKYLDPLLKQAER